MNEPNGLGPRLRWDDEKVTKGRKAPRWTVSFLRALERSGDVRASAADAGIDHSTAYARRRGHAEFALAWERALSGYSVAKLEQEREELAGLRTAHLPSPGSPAASPTSPARGRGELVGGAGQLKRAGHGRWSPRKEKLFFDELVATANVERSARTAGVSPQAVFARRLRDPHFAAKWAAVLETGKAAIAMHLIEEGRKSFESNPLEAGDAKPRVTIAEAIRIVQHGGKSSPSPFHQAPQFEEDIDEVRERLIKKLLRLKRRDRERRMNEGWGYDEAADLLVPPGWVRAG